MYELGHSQWFAYTCVVITFLLKLLGLFSFSNHNDIHMFEQFSYSI